MNDYRKETEEKWGDTEAYKQSQERVEKMGEEGLKKEMEKISKLNLETVECMKDGDAPDSPNTQKLILRHYEGLRAFYEPNLEMYRGLAEMYVEDERFRKNYESIEKGLAEYLKEGMLYFVETNTEEK